MEKRGCCYSYLYSVSYLTLTAGDKGIKCPSASPKQCRKGPSGTPPFATMAILSASLATSHRWLHSLLPRAPGRVPGRHVGGCAGVRVQSGSLPRQAPCRGRCLVTSGSLSLTGPCRDAWRIAANSLRCLGGPSRQAPLAGALSPWLGYFAPMPWFVFPASSSCRGLVALSGRVAHRGKFLGMPWLAFPASSSCRGLVSLA